MRQLLLLRHAKSSWSDKALSDHERGLNAEGRRAIGAMRQAMRELGLVPDLVLLSDARRTVETLDALEPWDDTPLVEAMPELYLATAQQLLQALRAVPETVRSVLMIGHNPGIHELSMTLAGAHAMTAGGGALQQLAAGYPTAALAEFLIAGPWWSLDAGTGRLLRFLAPRDLSELTA